MTSGWPILLMQTAGVDPAAVQEVVRAAETVAEPAAASGANPMVWLIGAFVVTTVIGGIVFSVYTLMYPTRTAEDRLLEMAVAHDPEQQANLEVDAAVERIAARLGQIGQGQENDDAENLRVMLKHAGYKNRRAFDIFNGVRLGALLFLPVFVSPMGAFWDLSATAFAMVFAAALGYYLPLIVLHSQASSRKADLLRAFPDALDLLVSSVESGQAMDAAFRRVASEMRAVSPSLSREFAMVNNEMNAGVTRVTALKHLEERTGIEEVRSLVNMMQQADRFGTSISKSLRMYAKVAREKRMSRAEEAAGQVGSKLTVIMIVFLLPVLMAVLLGPSAIRIIHNFTGG